MLGPNEKVELYIKQTLYHASLSIDSVAITNERIILRSPHALGTQKNYTDYSYKDIATVEMNKGMLRSTIKLTLRFGGEPLSLDNLSNADAETAYGIIRGNIEKLKTSSTSGETSAPPAKQEPSTEVSPPTVTVNVVSNAPPVKQEPSGETQAPPTKPES